MFAVLLLLPFAGAVTPRALYSVKVVESEFQRGEGENEGSTFETDLYMTTSVRMPLNEGATATLLVQTPDGGRIAYKQTITLESLVWQQSCEYSYSLMDYEQFVLAEEDGQDDLDSANNETPDFWALSRECSRQECSGSDSGYASCGCPWTVDHIDLDSDYYTPYSEELYAGAISNNGFDYDGHFTFAGGAELPILGEVNYDVYVCGTASFTGFIRMSIAGQDPFSSLAPISQLIGEFVVGPTTIKPYVDEVNFAGVNSRILLMTSAGGDFIGSAYDFPDYNIDSGFLRTIGRPIDYGVFDARGGPITCNYNSQSCTFNDIRGFTVEDVIPGYLDVPMATGCTTDFLPHAGDVETIWREVCIAGAECNPNEQSQDEGCLPWSYDNGGNLTVTSRNCANSFWTIDVETLLPYSAELDFDTLSADNISNAYMSGYWGSANSANLTMTSAEEGTLKTTVGNINLVNVYATFPEAGATITVPAYANTLFGNCLHVVDPTGCVEVDISGLEDPPQHTPGGGGSQTIVPPDPSSIDSDDDWWNILWWTLGTIGVVMLIVGIIWCVLKNKKKKETIKIETSNNDEVQEAKKEAAEDSKSK